MRRTLQFSSRSPCPSTAESTGKLSPYKRIAPMRLPVAAAIALPSLTLAGRAKGPTVLRMAITFRAIAYGAPPLRLGSAEPALPHIRGGEETPTAEVAALKGLGFLSPMDMGESWLGEAETERGRRCHMRLPCPPTAGETGSFSTAVEAPPRWPIQSRGPGRQQTRRDAGASAAHQEVAGAECRASEEAWPIARFLAAAIPVAGLMPVRVTTASTQGLGRIA